MTLSTERPWLASSATIPVPCPGGSEDADSPFVPRLHLARLENPLGSFHQQDQPHLPAGQVLFFPRGQDGFEVLPRRDQLQAVVRVSNPALVVLQFAPVDLLGLGGGRVAQGVPRPGFSSQRGGKQGRKHHGNPPQDPFRKPKRGLTVLRRYGSTRLALARAPGRLEIVTPKSQGVPGQVLVAVDHQGSFAGCLLRAGGRLRRGSPPPSEPTGPKTLRRRRGDTRRGAAPRPHTARAEPEASRPGRREC